MNLTVCHPCGPGLIPGRGGVFQRICPWLIALLSTHPEPAWRKMAQSPLNGTTQPVEIKEEDRSPTTYRQWPR